MYTSNSMAPTISNPSPTSILPLHRAPEAIPLLVRPRLLPHPIHSRLIRHLEIAPQRSPRLTGWFEREQLEIQIAPSPDAYDS